MRKKINHKIDFCMRECVGVCVRIQQNSATASKISADSVEEGQREKEIEK